MRKYSLSAALRHRWYATWRTCTSGGSASLVEKHNMQYECHSHFFSLTRRKYKYSYSGMREPPCKNLTLWTFEFVQPLRNRRHHLFVAHKCSASLWLLQKGVKRGSRALGHCVSSRAAPKFHFACWQKRIAQLSAWCVPPRERKEANLSCKKNLIDLPCLLIHLDLDSYSGLGGQNDKWSLTLHTRQRCWEFYCSWLLLWSLV